MSTLQHQDVFEPYFARPEERDESALKRAWKKRVQEKSKKDDSKSDEKH
ncbi:MULTISPECIES: hypothetical protein [Mesorhizobium]|nr:MULTISPECIES: hypothetical protein [Mesorhizobium]